MNAFKSCLIADDHPLLRAALASTVRRFWPGTVIDEAADWPTTWAEASRDQGLCLLDLEMPGAEPLDGLRKLLLQAPALPVLVVTASADDAMMLGVLECGVSGFASKTAEPEIIVAAISLILAGGRYLPDRLAHLAAMPLPARKTVIASQTASARLTERQQDVLKLLALGQSNKDIARAIGVAPATVKTHVAHVVNILGAANRTDAARKAEELGLLR